MPCKYYIGQLCVSLAWRSPWPLFNIVESLYRGLRLQPSVDLSRTYYFVAACLQRDVCIHLYLNMRWLFTHCNRCPWRCGLHSFRPLSFQVLLWWCTLWKNLLLFLLLQREGPDAIPTTYIPLSTGHQRGLGWPKPVRPSAFLVLKVLRHCLRFLWAVVLSVAALSTQMSQCVVDNIHACFPPHLSFVSLPFCFSCLLCGRWP